MFNVHPCFPPRLTTAYSMPGCNKCTFGQDLFQHLHFIKLGLEVFSASFSFKFVFMFFIKRKKRPPRNLQQRSPHICPVAIQTSVLSTMIQFLYKKQIFTEAFTPHEAICLDGWDHEIVTFQNLRPVMALFFWGVNLC